MIRIEKREGDFPVNVDYGVDLQERISKLDGANFHPYLVEGLVEPGEGPSDVSLTLVHFSGKLLDTVDTDQVIEAMRRDGLRPANVTEFLSFLETFSDYPLADPNLYHPIVALGSFWRSPAFVRWFPIASRHERWKHNWRNSIRDIGVTRSGTKAEGREWGHWNAFLAAIE